MKQPIPTLRSTQDEATSDASVLPTEQDHDLLQELISRSQPSAESPEMNISHSVHQKFKGWETAKTQLSEIQDLLVEAYQDLELMEVEQY